MAAAVAIPQSSELHGETLEAAKSQILDDIVNSQSDDISKIEVAEDVAEYFAQQRPFSARLYSARSRTDPWKCQNQAIRQMYHASVKAPRRRFFPGFRGHGITVEPFSVLRPITARQERLQKLKELKEKEIELLKEEEDKKSEAEEIRQEPETTKRFTRIEKKLNQKATDLMAKEPDAVGKMEEELKILAEELVREALIRSVQNIKVYNLASLLVLEAMEHAALELGLVTPEK